MDILIVDDHEENLYMLEILLKSSGHEVFAALNGAEAFEMVKAGGIDLIISDIFMPVMDGFQLCRKVKTDEALRAIPFIIYTATYTSSKDLDFAMKIGADRFIQKPCEPEILLKTVNEVMAAVIGPVRAPVRAEIREEEALKLYSERLVRKLEQKMVQAELEIKAREEIEKALLLSKERLIAAQKIAKMGDFTWDLETGEINWSEALYDLLKYEKSESFDFARVNSVIHHPDDLEEITRWFNSCVASGKEELTPKEYRLIQQDGQIIFVRTVGLIQQRAGKKPMLFATVQDITERAQAEEALRKSESKFRNLFHKHAAIKLIIDPYTGMILDANDAAEKFYGWSGEELRQMKIQDINTLSPQQVKLEIDKVLNGERIHFEFCHRIADGTVRDVAIYSSKVEIDGKLFIHSIIHDITNQRNLENQLHQAQKMESVGRLAGGVAHDYNNILSVIMGYTELAMGDPEITERLSLKLNEVLKAARRAADITRQLLAFARKQAIAPRVIEVNKYVEMMLKMLVRLIGEDIHLVWLPKEGLWRVNIDPIQIDQILANLCINSRDAIDGVGKITIETDNVVFDAAYCKEHHGFISGEFVMLAVSDNGCGMDREMLNIIFEPFFTTKSPDKGTGLGMSTVYGIVKQNKGFINIYSEPGLGTTVKIYLPRHEGSVIKVERENSEENFSGMGETVLIVEDDPGILKLAELILNGLGYMVLTSTTPGGALSVAAKHSGEIQLLITDVIMPEMNGLELAERLQSLYPKLKRIFMSGYTADVIARHGVLDGKVNFIQKPFSKKDFSKTVRKVLDEGVILS